jgi:hypothetical protein
MITSKQVRAGFPIHVLGRLSVTVSVDDVRVAESPMGHQPFG